MEEEEEEEEPEGGEENGIIDARGVAARGGEEVLETLGAVACDGEEAAGFWA